jgi:peptidoglycan-N-acetylglucosamine deacetylase
MLRIISDFVIPIFFFFILIGLSTASFLFVFQPRWLFIIATTFFPGAIYFFEPTQKVVALTIDDSPDSKTTPMILDTLWQYQAQATFFVLSDKMQENESIIAQMVAQGHELGNHLTKDEPSVKLSLEEFETKLLEAHRKLTLFDTPCWLRPGSGLYSKSMVDIAQKHGYRIVLGSVFPLDTHIHSPCFASNHILLNTRPGSIIILHDNGERGKRTVLTLKRILPELAERGYRVVSLSTLYLLG